MDDRTRRRARVRALRLAEQEAAWRALGLDRPELDQLRSHVDGRLAVQGCDHTLRFSRQWAEEQGRPWDRVAQGLQDAGGHCDCEVVANVDPEG